ncbi:TRAP transporter substrate-binding protein [Rhodoligotrophos ferricapiens]|uniref:TRAP transporter substrate-binding protein n=1 Tax=Rhodoligotrophos ferricapiens TaxID=3069264 RepID=UPI00315DE67C
MNDLYFNRRSALKGLGAIALLAAGARPSFASPLKWDFIIIYGPGHPSTINYKAFADDVRKRTNGELDITVRTPGELPFGGTEALTVVGQGQVQMSLGYMGFIAGTTKIAALPGLPFLIRNAEEADKSMEVLLPFVEKAVQAYGASILMWNGQHWPQNLYGRGKPIDRLDQLSGRNARGSTPEQADIIRRYGGAPVTLTTAEVPEAMERGLVDALFTGAANITGSKWTEFLEWGYLCNPHTGIEYMLINQQDYEGLPPEIRKVLDETVADHRPKMAASLKKVNDESQAILREKLKITDASEEDIKRYESDWAGYWTEWASGAGPDAEEALKKVREVLGK